MPMYSYEEVIMDNISEIENNGGKLEVPSLAVRPMI